MIRDCKLESHKSAFCHVVVHEDGVNLVSYETSVCQMYIDKASGRAFLYCSGNYSASTIKHIGWFTTEFTGHNLYYVIKQHLLKAQHHNMLVYHDKISGELMGYITIELTNAETANLESRIKWYKENGSYFHKYSKEPNYDFNQYGYRRMEPIILP